MILMINGAFGVGKTTVATKLLELLPNSMLYDPEEIGYMLRNIIPDVVKTADERTDNFQDLALWKILVVQVAQLLHQQYGKNLVVPMTIINPTYFHYIYSGFQAIDPETHHFCLVAREETIYNRLKQRGETEGNWCFQQTRACLKAYQEQCFGPFIMTDDVSVDQVAERIIAMLVRG
ncbi:MAG: AAA family ATPase [Clostridia bacterium]